VFKLTDLTQMYKNRLEQHDPVVEGRMHSSRLKDKLLSVSPDLQAHPQGNNIVLMKILVLQAFAFDNDAMHLVCAAKIVHKEIFEKKFSFFR